MITNNILGANDSRNETQDLKRKQDNKNVSIRKSSHCEPRISKLIRFWLTLRRYSSSFNTCLMTKDVYSRLFQFNWVEKCKSCIPCLSITCLIKDTRLWRLSHWDRIICEVEFVRNYIRTILILDHDHTRSLCIQGTLNTKSGLNYSLLPRE